jgi:HAD superfamily hydrolase (TIGR01509 family)
MKLDAIIFDFDGVLADTEPLHFEAFLEVLVPLGLGFTWDDYVQSYIGFDDRDAFAARFREAGRGLAEAELKVLIRAKAEAFALLSREKGRPYPGVAELVRTASAMLPVALCSGALRQDIEPYLERMALQDCFRAVVTAEEVSASKPDPESYLLALERLARTVERPLTPGACLALEDTPAGIASAQGAGLRVIAVATTHPGQALAAADAVVSTLEGATPESLSALLMNAS